MSYIDRNLLPDEQILFRTKKHLIIFIFPILVLLFSAYVTPVMAANQVLAAVKWVPSVITLLFWSVVGLAYYTSEFAVTNKRIMMREGFFNRHANEMRLTAISQVNVYQNLIGQLMNFGTVSINAFGAFDSYTLISNPGAFQRMVNQQIDKALTGAK
jgi:uncharacterized membrane protein YdbT with pleckstrin-like domain